jgi:adenylate cyclase
MKTLFISVARAIASRRAFGLLLVALAVLLRLWDPRPIEELRLRSFDLYQHAMPRSSQERPVVIVDIDEASVAAFGQWPWPRTLLADLLTRLYEMECVAIGFDVVFAEPDRTSPAEAAKYFRNLDEGTRELLAHLPSNDQIFAQAIGQGKVVLGQSGTNSENTRWPGQRPETGFATLGADPKPFLVGFPYLLRNLSELEQAAAGRGLFSIQPERDGIVRRVPIVMTAEDKIVPALTLDMLRLISGSNAILIRTDEAGVHGVAVPGLELPTDEHGRIWIHYRPPDRTLYVSAKDVIEGKVAPDRFAGRLVLLGTSAIGLLDVKTTPVSAAMPGVEVHAQLLESALTDSLLSRPNYAIAVEMVLAIVAGAALALAAPIAGALTLFAGAFLIASAFLAGSWFAYSQYRMLFDASFPLTAMLSVYMSVVVIGYFREQLDRQRIRSAFAQYLSPTLVERLAKSPKQLKLGGEDRVMTVLFSDVRGFTTIAETYKDNPNGLTHLMNRFLTPLTNEIIARNGTIDKYIGDAIMAFWNAPLDDASHENDACDAALGMLACVDALNRERQREAASNGDKFTPISMGIGINTGHCTVGNMGSDLRFQYTVMGNTVNLASRVESLTRLYGVSIIIGSRTAANVANKFALLEIDSVRVKGKADAEVIYTILARTDGGESGEVASLQNSWGALLVCYRKQDWDGARQMLEACRADCERFGLAGLIEAYSERIQRLQQYPPGAGWNGVFTAETK